jgi:multisubunit Na+/H+ antiporter MnhB subunit
MSIRPVAKEWKRARKQLARNRRILLGAACLLVVGFFMLMTVLQPGFAGFGRKISSFYIEEGWTLLKAANTVTSVVWDFRGYDTLGEESVLFCAAIGIFALGFGLHARHRVHREVKEK